MNHFSSRQNKFNERFYSSLVVCGAAYCSRHSNLNIVKIHLLVQRHKHKLSTNKQINDGNMTSYL